MLGITFSAKFILTIIHLFGLALGFGGAMASDAIFFSSLSDRKLVKTEMRFLVLGGKLVWTGLAILFFSGLGLFLTNPSGYIESSKFVSKMIIVLVIGMNGLLMHGWHLPWLESIQGKRLSKVRSASSRRIFLLISGVISIWSWLSALVLGALRFIEWPIATVLGIYFAGMLIGIVGALILRDILLPLRRVS